MNETVAKLTFTGFLAALSVWWEMLAIPVFLLAAVMILDYATGMMAAAHRGEIITSHQSIKGITKKVCHLLLVVVGLVLDGLILYGKEMFGWEFPWSFVVAAVIAVWLIANEVISILENIQDITGSLPPWLLPIAKNIKGKVETLHTNNEEE